MYKSKKFKTESEAREFMRNRIDASLIFLCVFNLNDYSYKVEYRTKA